MNGNIKYRYSIFQKNNLLGYIQNFVYVFTHSKMISQRHFWKVGNSKFSTNSLQHLFRKETRNQMSIFKLS